MVDLALLLTGVLLGRILPAIYILVVAGVGIVTFLGILAVANFFSQSLDLNRGEMRKALASAFTASFLTLVAVLAFTKDIVPADLAQNLIEAFKWIIITIIAFYFGTRTIKEVKPPSS